MFSRRKIQESAEVYGNEAEVKSMRLHRRRRASLDAILKEQIAKCVTQEAEKRMGIPPAEDQEGRMTYAVECLYSFDLCCCKLVEKCVSPWQKTGPLIFAEGARFSPPGYTVFRKVLKVVFAK